MTFDLQHARQDTPGCEHVLHFNNAGASLMPKPVLDATIGAANPPATDERRAPAVLVPLAAYWCGEHNGLDLDPALAYAVRPSPLVARRGPVRRALANCVVGGHQRAVSGETPVHDHAQGGNGARSALGAPNQTHSK